ncbi:MAG: glycosyltransferase family 39 protein, partial [Acidobacteria bacterium]|nr:glycosyltransferase family 39 protein [Acidobacteriota bacterium]
RTARPEMLLAFSVTAAIACGLVALDDTRSRSTRWWVLASAAAALAFLTKGPVGVAVPALVLLPVVATGRRWRRLRFHPLALAALVFLVIAVPWYALMAREHGMAYLRGFFVGDNLERFATARYNDPRSPFYYLPVVLGGLLPWSPFFLAALPSAWGLLRRRARLSARDAQLVAWVAMPLLLVTASVGKQAHYALPMLPPLSLLLARVIRDRLGPDLLPGRDLRRRLFRAAGVLAGLVLAVIGPAIVRASPLLLHGNPGTITLAAGVVVAAGLAVAALSLSSRWTWAPAALAAATAATIVSLQLAVVDPPGPDAVEQLAREIAIQRGAGEQVGTYRIFGRSLVFYTHVQQVGIYDDAGLQAFLSSPERVLCVLPEADLVRLKQVRPPGLRRLATIRYFDPATAKPRTLLWPDATRDVQTAVLVSNR